ncbi:CsbD family protein [Methylorubrum aminovorans]
MVDTDRITGAAKELGGKVQGAVGDLTGLRSDAVEGRFREAQGSAENLYGQAKDAVRHAADDAYEVAEDAYEQGRRYLRGSSREVGEYVSDAPLASLLVAGAIGFGLGLLVSKL